MRSSWPLLTGVAVTVLITATLASALASFGSEELPLALHRQLARSAAVSIVISGQVNAATAAADTRAVRASMRNVLRDVPYQLDQALWSDPLGLPSPRGSRTVPLTEAVASGPIEANATLVAGAWPGRPVPGRPVGAALPVTAADQLRLAPGALLMLRDRDTGRRIRVRVTGLFALRDPAARFWGIDLVSRSGVSAAPPYITYGPLVVNPAALGSGGLAVGGVSWVVLPDGARMGGSGLPALAGRITAAESYLQNSAQLGGLQVSTGLPALLAGLGRNLVVARSLLTMGIVQLLLLAAAALALAARLLASHRDEESAMLAARGAARWQLARPAAAEAALLCVVAAAAGALLGGRLAGLLLAAAGLPATGPRVPAAAWWATVAVLALSTVILLWPSLRPSAPGVASARRGRPALLAGIAQAGGDLALVALAVIAVWELRSYSAVAHPGTGGLGIDPVPVLAPALALAGLTLVPLRLLPALARAIDGLIGRTRRLGAALASWEISRRPVRQSGPVLLVILAVGTGSLALAQYQSWRRSVQDQAAFTTGADVRVGTLAPLPLASSDRIARAPGVIAAMPVAAGVTGSGGQIIGLDARQAAATVLLRPDLSPQPASRLWRRIIPSWPAPGLALPGRPAWLRITASLAPGPAGSLGPVTATVAIQDSGGAVYDVPAGLLPTDGRPHALTTSLSPGRGADYPLRLLGISLDYTLPAHAGASQSARVATHPARLVIHALAAGPAGRGPAGASGSPPGAGAATVFAGGSALASWRPAASAPELGISLGYTLPTAGGPPAVGTSPAVQGWQAARGGGQVLSFTPGQSPAPSVLASAGVTRTAIVGVLTVTVAAPTKVIPGIATEAFLRGSAAGIGSVVPVTVSGISIPVRIVAAVSQFPTVSGGVLIVDQAALQDLLASQWQPPLPVVQWWLHTTAGAAPSGLPRGAAVTVRNTEAAAGLANLLSAVPEQAALAIAAAAALLAAVGFTVSVTASLRARQVQNAVLAALGVARGGQAGQLCLEQLLLSLPAAAAGLLAGAVLAHLLVPAVTLTTAATTPVPPVLVEFPWRWAVVLALAVAVIPVVVAAVTIAHRPDPAAQLRAAQAG
ncbi:MAG TPA: FtsX-like permease family protein [Streptosporangiaceae bacterium]